MMFLWEWIVDSLIFYNFILFYIEVLSFPQDAIVNEVIYSIFAMPIYNGIDRLGEIETG